MTTSKDLEKNPMRYVFMALMAASTISAVPGMAWSQTLTGNVGSAGISAGDRSIEARAGFDAEGNLASRVHYDQAVSDWYQFRVIAAFGRPEDGDVDFSGLTFENWFQWAEEANDQSGFDGGVRLSYTFSDGGGPDEAAVSLTLTDRFAGDWEWRANASAEIETGSGRQDGAELETRFQLTRAIDVNIFATRDWRFGGELFSEYGSTDDIASFDDQAHQAGPVVKAEWASGVFLQFAVRAGLTGRADDLMAKLSIGREF